MQANKCKDEKQKLALEIQYRGWAIRVWVRCNGVCMCVLLCALCTSPIHAPMWHNGPEIWEQAQAERSGNGMGQTGGTLSFRPSLKPFPLWCPLINLPSAHSSFIYPPSMEHSASLFSPACLLSLQTMMLYLIYSFPTVAAFNYYTTYQNTLHTLYFSFLGYILMEL